MNAASLRPGSHRALAAIVLLLAMLQPAVSFAADWDIDQLMQSLAKTRSGRATFVEKKYISMLDRPVESSGELLYTAPDRLEKRTVKPKPEAMLVEGDVLVIERGRQKHTLRLQDYPELAGFIDSIRGTLSGDRKALERSYKLKLEGGAERWTLMLLPTDARMAATIHLIRITGDRDNVRGIEIIQTDGDRSQMTIERAASQ
jgi:outer membrane lipoprotein-sorting protein